MPTSITARRMFKQNLPFLCVALACSAIVARSSAQTLNFVNQASDRVWNSEINWNPPQLPTHSAYAAVDWSVAAELYITDGNGTISAAASVGTLAIDEGVLKVKN